MKDSFNRDINYLRVSITDRCNLRCKYCMSQDGISTKLTHDDILSFDEIVYFVKIAAKYGINSVRITGGEPLVRKGVEDLISMINKIDGINDIAMTTNAILLPKYAKALKSAGLNRINISLDSLDALTFKEITRVGNLDDVLAGIDSAMECGFDPIKINCVANKSHDINFFEIAKLSVEKNLHVRFIEYMPIGINYNSDNFISWQTILDSINIEAKNSEIGQLIKMDYRPNGNGPAKYYKFIGAKGSVGFISAITNQFCNSCNRIRLTADGKIRPCLFSDDEYNVREYLRDKKFNLVEQMFVNAINNKPKDHGHTINTLRQMNQIGG